MSLYGQMNGIHYPKPYIFCQSPMDGTEHMGYSSTVTAAHQILGLDRNLNTLMHQAP
jgi:hypothetical protein